MQRVCESCMNNLSVIINFKRQVSACSQFQGTAVMAQKIKLHHTIFRDQLSCTEAHQLEWFLVWLNRHAYSPHSSVMTRLILTTQSAKKQIKRGFLYLVLSIFWMQSLVTSDLILVTISPNIWRPQNDAYILCEYKEVIRCEVFMAVNCCYVLTYEFSADWCNIRYSSKIMLSGYYYCTRCHNRPHTGYTNMHFIYFGICITYINMFSFPLVSSVSQACSPNTNILPFSVICTPGLLS
jgi:hypothetical protein